MDECMNRHMNECINECVIEAQTANMVVGVSDLGRRNSGTSRDTSLTLRPSNSNATALVPSSRRSSTQDTALALQQPSQAMVVRSGSSGLMPSSGAGEFALLDEEEMPKAEHQLRQKVLLALQSLLLFSLHQGMACKVSEP